MTAKSCKKRKITTIRRMSIFKVLALCGICLLTSVFIAIHTYIHTSTKTKYRKNVFGIEGMFVLLKLTQDNKLDRNNILTICVI